MSKKNRFLTILVCIALIVTLTFSLIACNKTENDGDEVTDSGKIIANGNFELASTGEFPKSPTSWKGGAGSTASDNATETDAKHLVSGVIDVSKTSYDSNKRKWDKPTNPNATSKVENDNNILMIYNKKSTAYRYTSNDFTLDSNKFYSVTVDVRTDDIEGEGVYIGIGGDAYQLVHVGNTRGEWKTYTFFFETSNLESNKVNLVLSNGLKGKSDGKLSKGYAFFDNAIVAEVEAKAYNEAAPGDTLKKSSMKLSDANFENVSLTGKNNYTPNKWSGVSSGDSSTGSDYLEKGIVDVSESRPEFLPANFNPIGTDTKMLFLNNKQKTAYGYRMDKRIRFEADKYYKLTFNVATFIDATDIGDSVAPNEDDAGAYVRVKTGTGTTDTVTNGEIRSINTHGVWQQVSFIIKADSKRNKDYYIELGLGQGNKADPTQVMGKAFFDNIALTEVAEGDYDDAVTDTGKLHKLDFDSTYDDNKLALANRSDYYTEDAIAYKDSHITYKGDALTVRDTTAWDDTWGANPLTPNNAVTTVLEMKNSQPTANIIKFEKSNYQSIKPNSYYRMSAWVKTADIAKGKGVNLSLYSYDTKLAGERPSLEEKDLITKLTSFDNINTDNIKNHVTSSYKDYVELVFFIEGDLLINKDVFMQVSLGSGNFMESAKHVKGTAYLADVSMYEVKYADYNAESGTYIKKHSFKSTSGSIANGEFDEVNKQNTLKVFSEKNPNFELEYNSSGVLNNAFGLPASWTTSDESYLRSSINAGIINNQSAWQLEQINKGFTGGNLAMDDSFYRGFEKEFGANTDGSNVVKSDTNRNVLVINSKPAKDDYVITEPTKPEVCGCTCKACIDNGFCKKDRCDGSCNCAHYSYSGKVKPWGFTSPSMSLTADSHYLVSVWAYVAEGEATISLKTNSKDQTKSFNILSDPNSNWKRYDFFVETGFDGTSVNLELFLGNKSIDEAVYNGTVFFDMPRYIKVTEEIYDQAQKDKVNAVSNIEIASYTVTTFDNVTTNEDNLNSAVGWTGEHKDADAPAESKDVVSGVYDYYHGNRNWFGKDDGDTRIPADALKSIYGSDNNNTLVINNNVATEYAFTYKMSKTLNSAAHYKFSIDVYTHNVDKNAHATITLKLEGRSYTFGKDADKKVLVNTAYNADGTPRGNGWKTYNFYVSTPSSMTVDNVSLTLALGAKNKENYVQGYAFFDNMNISKIKEDEFPKETKPENVAQEDEYKYDKSITHRIVFTEDDAKTPDPDDDDKKSDPLMWLYISSGVIGGLLILAVIAFFVKKYYKPRNRTKKTTKGTEAYNRNRVDANGTAPSSTKARSSDKHKDK